MVRDKCMLLIIPKRNFCLIFKIAENRQISYRIEKPYENTFSLLLTVVLSVFFISEMLEQFG